MKYRGAIAVWAVLGVVVFLARAIYGLVPMALDLGPHLNLTTGIACAASVVFMVYSEGYRGFQQRFSPRVVVRAGWLADNPRPWLVLLAPIFAMGLIYATRRRLITSWSIAIGVTLLVLLVRQLQQPWRGIVDAGVVAGLGWGTAAIVVFWFLAMAGHPPDADPEVPAGATATVPIT